ncbi:hypothetical protein GCM10022393_25690 [Aquimarina addita]|uniref:Ricin B lectin domain-containing protein n=2 Tax=Aquimarina addita TaxID=870485 RepID=A0ABP6UKZ3_9FLAO
MNADNRSVSLGGDIQDAIDYVSSTGGGTVTLAAGTFTINESLKIKSNVTLQGSGTYASTIKTTQNIKIIEQAGYGLKNITIRNLTLTGTNQVDGGGMDIVSYGTDHDTILISNVRCYNTGWGVHIKGAKNLTVENCDFSKNGTKGKEGFAHNMYLRRVYGATVKNSSFNYSTSANGINISYSEDIEIYNSEMIGNYFRGVRAADTEGYLVHNCIITDNGFGADDDSSYGLGANSENFTARDIDFQDNCVANNDRQGIYAKSGATGIIKNNNSYGNGDDYDVTSVVSQSGNISSASQSCGSVVNPPTNSSVVHLRKRNASGFAIDGNWGGANTQNIFLWSQNAGNVNQQWNEIDRGNGYYSYQKVNTNYCIDGNNGGANGQNVYLWECSNNNQNQHWKKVDVGNGNYRLEKRNASGFSLDGNKGGVNGQNLYLWESNNSNQNQHWTFGSANKSNDLASKDNVISSEAFPNPFENVLNIRLGNSQAKGRVDITNTLGQVVFSKNITNGAGFLALSTLESGIYLAKITSGTEISTIRVLKK